MGLILLRANVQKKTLGVYNIPKDKMIAVLKKLGFVYDHSSSYSKNDGSATFESDVYVLEIEK